MWLVVRVVYDDAGSPNQSRPFPHRQDFCQAGSWLLEERHCIDKNGIDKNGAEDSDFDQTPPYVKTQRCQRPVAQVHIIQRKK